MSSSVGTQSIGPLSLRSSNSDFGEDETFAFVSAEVSPVSPKSQMVLFPESLFIDNEIPTNPIQTLFKWLISFCVVVFDVEIGHSNIYPRFGKILIL